MSLIEVPYHKLSVLVVEDENHTRTIIKSLLRQIGVRTIVDAANGRDGLIEVVRERPHMVLCDVHMKPIDGLEFLKTLRAMNDKGVEHTPVVFLTADAKPDTVKFAKEHAISGYIVKPPSVATLKARIDAVAATLKL